jgi:hypothetical protein
MLTIFQQFGVDPAKFYWQLSIFIVAALLAIRATIRAIHAYRGVELPLWILIAWLFPFVGPIMTLIVIHKHRSHSIP